MLWQRPENPLDDEVSERKPLLEQPSGGDGYKASTITLPRIKQEQAQKTKFLVALSKCNCCF
jgi:hypothetical protein